MISELHFIRPYWLLTLIPYVVYGYHLLKRDPGISAWRSVCDAHLLPALIQTKPQLKRHFSTLILLASGLCMVLALSGPSWSRYPVPSYKPIQPRVIVLNLSNAMLIDDLPPNRLSRAKFKLHDLLSHRQTGQYGLIVYTEEPFVVSPLTEDSHTIDTLLSSLSPDIMPVQGDRLDQALVSANQLMTQAGFHEGHILVLTSTTPNQDTIDMAAALKRKGIQISVMPILNPEQAQNPRFEQLAMAGGGQLIPFSNTASDIQQWLRVAKSHPRFGASSINDIPVWRDQGRLFIIPALLLLLPVFRRGWLQRVTS